MTGCPKSGTHYTNALLRRAGVRTGHEQMGYDGTVSCFFAVDDWWYTGAHRGERLATTPFRYRFHQIRHPLRTIGSLEAFRRPVFWHWQEKHTGIDGGLPDIERAAAFWIAWNDLIQATRPDLTYRVEAMEEVWPQIAERLGIDLERPPKVPKTIGRTAHRDITWDDLGEWAEPVRKKAAEYGYAV